MSTIAPFSDSRAPKESRIHNRFIILGLLCLAGAIAWADRLALSIAAPVILEERGWSKTDLGIVFSAFSTGYLILQIPAGRLADKFGGLRVLGFAILIWSLLSGVFPIAATTIATITILRVLLGLSQGAYGPCQASIISQFFQKDETSKAVGIANCGVFGGQMIAPLLGAWIVVTWGWHRLFYVLGAAGAVWCVLVFLFQYSTKRSQPHEPSVAEDRNAKEAGSWGLLMSSSVWVAALAFIPSLYGLWLFYSWLPTYLVTARNFSLLQTGFYGMLPYFMALLGNLAAGWLSSALIRKGCPVNVSRKVIICVCYGGFALSILLAAYTESAISAVVFISLAMGFLGGNLAIFWTLPIDFSRKHAGFIGGFMSTVSDLGGMVAPVITGFIVQTTGRWENAFAVGAALAIIGMLLTAVFLSVKPLKLSPLPGVELDNQ